MMFFLPWLLHLPRGVKPSGNALMRQRYLALEIRVPFEPCLLSSKRYGNYLGYHLVQNGPKNVLALKRVDFSLCVHCSFLW
jgi:hypothetical protein